MPVPCREVPLDDPTDEDSYAVMLCCASQIVCVFSIVYFLRVYCFSKGASASCQLVPLHILEWATDEIYDTQKSSATLYLHFQLFTAQCFGAVGSLCASYERPLHHTVQQHQYTMCSVQCPP